MLTILSWSTKRSLPSRGAWIEIRICAAPNAASKSLPSRGAWIEISMEVIAARALACRSLHGERGLKYQWRYGHQCYIDVAPFTGSVD